MYCTIQTAKKQQASPALAQKLTENMTFGTQIPGSWESGIPVLGILFI
jgi:hypothetical protein